MAFFSWLQFQQTFLDFDFTPEFCAQTGRQQSDSSFHWKLLRFRGRLKNAGAFEKQTAVTLTRFR